MKRIFGALTVVCVCIVLGISVGRFREQGVTLVVENGLPQGTFLNRCAP